MAALYEFELVTPERSLFDGEVEEVSMRTEGGDIAFLAGHVQFIGTVQIGALRITVPDEPDVVVAIHGGLAEVREGKLVVVAGLAERAEEIDIARAERARDGAETQFAADPENLEAQADLHRAVIRLEVAQTTQVTHVAPSTRGSLNRTPGAAERN